MQMYITTTTIVASIRKEAFSTVSEAVAHFRINDDAKDFFCIYGKGMFCSIIGEYTVYRVGNTEKIFCGNVEIEREDTVSLIAAAMRNSLKERKNLSTVRKSAIELIEKILKI